MTAAGNALIGIAVACVLWGVASAVMIGGALENRGVKVNWIWFRVLILSRYMGQYRDITRRETGRPGPLYYSYIFSMLLALVTAVAGLILRAL